MATQNDPDLKFYYERLKEFERLLAATKSKTFQDLLQIATGNTEASLAKFSKLQHMTTVILVAKKITTEKQFREYTLHIEQASADLEAGKFSSADQYSNLINDIKAHADRDKRIYELSLDIYTLAVKQFQRVLFELICKPNNTSFHYESILDVLQYLAGKVFPGLDEVRSVRRIVPGVRKKEFAKTGDKMLLYLEQYLDVLEKWNDLAEAYIDILED